MDWMRWFVKQQFGDVTLSPFDIECFLKHTSSFIVSFLLDAVIQLTLISL